MNNLLTFQVILTNAGWLFTGQLQMMSSQTRPLVFRWIAWKDKSCDFSPSNQHQGVALEEEGDKLVYAALHWKVFEDFRF